MVNWTQRIRLQHLEVLVSLVETKNISRSAHLFHMTQPGLSKWLKELESDIGLPLFERHARGLRPTAYGLSLVEFAVRIRNELARARDEMAALREGSSGRMLIGASGAGIASVAAEATLKLLEIMPSVRVQLLEAPMDVLLQQLTTREIDLAVGRRSARYSDPDLALEVLYCERLYFAVRPGHPLTTCTRVEWDDLLSYRWVLWSPNIPARELLEASLASAGQTAPKNSVVSNSIFGTVALVAKSNMVAALSERALELPERMKTLQRLPVDLEARGEVAAFWRKDVATSTAQRLMLGILKAATGAGGRSGARIPSSKRHTGGPIRQAKR
jgi:DNA-binding transcriptional LysR family regulator